MHFIIRNGFITMVRVLRPDTAKYMERHSAKFVGLASLDECHEGTHSKQLSIREWICLENTTISILYNVSANDGNKDVRLHVCTWLNGLDAKPIYPEPSWACRICQASSFYYYTSFSNNTSITSKWLRTLHSHPIIYSCCGETGAHCSER